MQSLSQFEGFTKEQIIATLHMLGGSRRVAFRYELLDKDDNIKADLKNVLSGSIEQRAQAYIKRTAKFSIKEGENINYLTDKIKPYFRLFIPPGRILARYYTFLSTTQPALYQKLQESGESGWIEFPLGVFHLSSPTRRTESDTVIREVEAYDGLVVLLDDKFDSRYTISSGTNYVDAAKTILSGAGITKINIDSTDKTLPKDLEFDPGKEKLFALNELLRQINYVPVHVGPNGYYTSFTYRSPADRASEYTYATDDESVTFPNIEETLDLWEVPNKWVVTRTNPEQDPLTSTYTNTNSNNPTSTVNRGRTIVDFREVENIADQASLDAYTERIAFQESQIYGYIGFETAIMPHHDYADVLQIDFSELGVKGKYAETEWSYDLKEGARMKHQVRKVVKI